MIDSADTVPGTDLLDLRHPLLWPLVPPARRDAVSALWALDSKLAELGKGAREPALRQIRLRWWAERLEAMADGAEPPPEPVLQMVAARDWQQSTLLALAELADAHGNGPPDGEDADVAKPGSILFGLTQSMLYPAAASVGHAARAGEGWACVRAALMAEAGECQAALFAAATQAPAGQGIHRSLAALSGVARVIARAGGRRRSRREQLCVLRIGLFGR